MFDSVLTRSISDQPSGPEVGDRLLVPPAATGVDWSGKDGRIAIYLESGWHFAIYPIGRLIFIEDEGAFYHRDQNGSWIAGVGTIALVASSIPITSIIGAKASTLLKVENQTINAPPSSPVVPTAYIIGPSPTGSWSGQSGKLAICLVTGSFTIINPDEGDEVYDKSLKADIKFNGSVWLSAAGSWVAISGPVLTTGSTGFAGGGGTSLYSDTVPPVNTATATPDPATITHTAKRAGALLRISYRARVTWASGNTGTSSYTSNIPAVLAVFRDSVTNAIAWCTVNNITFVDPGTFAATFNDLPFVNEEFLVTAPDTAAHVYKIVLLAGINDFTGASNDQYHYASALSRRQFMIEESA
ncbi:DUF2793 domain-containing protein [Bradyrhizobium prioriisuperbiae]|uniref:DUF2793 domain-containing protein n=1 Tax=Bradyrhizobium prioriisuperbiae TaxID=2854389 RepID=UPI0028F14C0B|nr:DUF2793 domain-containing protein [Bradyrhizobium prioritasuperba]